MPIKGNTTSALSRLQGKFVIDIATECHIWTGSLNSQSKYPSVSQPGSKKPIAAYRVAWEAVNGICPTTPPPHGSDRWEFHHACENKRCVNANHIQVVTRKQHAAIHRGLRESRKLKDAA